MSKLEVIEKVAPVVDAFLARHGQEFLAAAEKLYAESQVGKLPKPYADIRGGLGPALKVVRADFDEYVALFDDKKAAVHFNDGLIKLFDTAPIPSVVDSRSATMLYDSAARGKELLNSLHIFNTNTFTNVTYSLHQTLTGPELASRLGANDAFLTKAIPEGSIPIGTGRSRIAFLTEAKQVSLLGPPDFRPPFPDMLFPLHREVNQSIQFETLPLARLDKTTAEHLEDMIENAKLSGWDFYDDHRLNLGSVEDGSFKVIDSGAVKRLGGGAGFNHLRAAELHRNALINAVENFGANSHTAGGFHAEVGWHLKNVGEFQSAEEHLSTGFKLLEEHQDWKAVRLAATRLSKFHYDANDHSKGTEFAARSVAAEKQWGDWISSTNQLQPNVRPLQAQ